MSNDHDINIINIIRYFQSTKVNPLSLYTIYLTDQLPTSHN